MIESLGKRQKLAKLIGLGLSVVALATFLFIFAEALSGADVKSLAEDHWQSLLIATATYCIAYVPMTLAWIGLARAVGAQTSKGALARVLLVSQIGKYLPGNFAQFLGRAYLARRYGVEFASTGLAIALELAGILAASAILAIISVALGFVAPQPNGAPFVLWIVGPVGLGAFVVSAWVIYTKGRARRALSSLLWAVCCYLIVLSLLAVANVIVIADISGDESFNAAGRVAAAFLVSWLIGFVTPGSPAGIGLRELSFLALLAGSFPHDAVLLAAAGFRLVTIFGDVLAWFLGTAMRIEEGEVTGTNSIPI